MINDFANIAERFWSKVDVRGENDCWPWKGATQKGYGHFRLNNPRRTRKAHTISYELTYGEFPTGMEGCHTCDNPICCNPKHVFPGSHADNMRDMIAKGRRKSPTYKGSQNPNAVLCEENVVVIKQLINSGQNNTEIGRRFSVSHSMISRIRRGLAWTHVALPL